MKMKAIIRVWRIENPVTFTKGDGEDKDGSDSQYLQSGDFVPQHLLGLVEVSQHDVSLSVMDHTQLPQVALMSLGKVLLMGPTSEARRRTLSKRPRH